MLWSVVCLLHSGHQTVLRRLQRITEWTELIVVEHLMDDELALFGLAVHQQTAADSEPFVKLQIMQSLDAVMQCQSMIFLDGTQSIVVIAFSVIVEIEYFVNRLLLEMGRLKQLLAVIRYQKQSVIL